MKLKQIKLNLWHRYILYYCVVFIIPFIVLAVFTFKFSLGKVEEQFDSNIRSNLNQSERILLSQIKELDNISMQISKDSYVSYSKMDHDYYSNIGKEILSRYASSKSLIDDIVLFYFSTDEKYYSSQGSYNDISVLKEKYYKDVDISKSTLRKIFYFTTPQIVSLPIYDKDEARFKLTYVFPLYDSNGRQSGTATFLLDEEELRNILPVIDTDNKNEIYVTNSNNYVLLSNNQNLHKEFIDSNGKMLEEVIRNNTYNTSSNEYRIIKYSSDELGLKFINILDSKDLVTSLINTKMYIFKLLSILFLVGLLLILSISYFQYKPIRRIYTALNDKRKSSFIKEKKNELKSIEILVKDIMYQNEELMIKNEALYHIDKNQVLLDLIEGVDQGKEKSSFIVDLESEGNSYYIALVKKAQLSKESKLLIHKVLSIKNTKYMTFTIQIPLQDKLGILVVHKDSSVKMEESLRDIENKLFVLKEDVYLYCGQVYEELSKINHSYIEAMIACDYIINDIENKCILYREANYSSGNTLKYPYDIEEKLAHGLKQGTQEVVSDSLEQIFEFINSNKYYYEEIKVYSFYLINTITRLAALMNFPSEEVNIRELAEYSTLDELEENILKLVNRINQFVLSKRSKVRDEFREGIFIDILENYKSHDLSLELLSQKYDYSVPYLSKMIKEETGMTFTKYIQDLRLKFIKGKLIETDLPIKEIIHEAGYYDISNFSRKFKNIMGVTPGQYREINKSNKISQTI